MRVVLVVAGAACVSCQSAETVAIEGIDDQQIVDVVRYGGDGADRIDAAAIDDVGARLIVAGHFEQLSFADQLISDRRGTSIFAHERSTVRFAHDTPTAFQVVRAAPMSEGGWIVAAGFFGSFVHPNGETLDARGAHDSVLLRLASDGEILWTRQLFAEGDTFVNAVVPDALGNIFVAGRFAGLFTFDGQRRQAMSGDDAFLAKVDPSGAVVWLRQISSDGADTMGAAVLTRTQGVVIAGGFRGELILDDFSLLAERSAYLAQFDPNGLVTNARSFGGSDTEVTALVVDETDGDVLVGATFRATLTVDGLSKRSRGQTDIAIARLDREFRAVHLDRYGGDVLDVLEDLTLDRYGWTWLVGTVRGDEPSFGRDTADDGSTDAIVMGLSPNHAPRFVWRIGGMGDQIGAAVGTAEGFVHVVGLFRGTPVRGLPADAESFALFGLQLVAR